MGSRAKILIEDWQERLALISTSLNDLVQSQNAQRVRVKVGKNAYQGDTLDKANYAIDKLEELLADFLVLNSLVSEAGAERRNNLLNLMGFNEREVIDRLESASISKTLKVPLGERTLLGGDQQRQAMTPKMLLEKMEADFILVRNFILSIEATENSVKLKSSQLKLDFERLLQRVKKFPELERDFKLIDFSRIESDPIGAEDFIDAMTRLLKGYAHKVTEAEQMQDNAKQSLYESKIKLEALCNAENQLSDALKRITNGSLQPVFKSGDFSQWLNAIELSFSNNQWNATQVGLQKWQDAIDNAIVQQKQWQEELIEFNRSYEDIKGRFSALKIKENSLRVKNRLQIDEMQLQGIKQQIEAGLTKKPVQLEDLKVFMQQYQNCLQV